MNTQLKVGNWHRLMLTIAMMFAVSACSNKIERAIGSVIDDGTDAGPFEGAYDSSYKYICSNQSPPSDQTPGQILPRSDASKAAPCDPPQKGTSSSGAAGPQPPAPSVTAVPPVVAADGSTRTVVITFQSPVPPPHAQASTTGTTSSGSTTKTNDPAEPYSVRMVKACPDDAAAFASGSPNSANVAGMGSQSGAPPGAASSSPGAPSAGKAGFLPCEAAIVRAAVDNCTYNTLKGNHVDVLIGETTGGTLIVAGAAAAGIAALAGAKAAISAAVGVGVAILGNAGGSLLKLLPSGTPASVEGMISNAQQYVALRGTLTERGDPETYYQGLWNAVGAACSPTEFAIYPIKLPTKDETKKSGTAEPAK